MRILLGLRAASGSEFNPFTIETADTIGTDFSPYSLGTPPDWSASVLGATSSLPSLDIQAGGQYGKKLYLSGGATGAFSRAAAWLSSRFLATDNQEILVLVKPISGARVTSVVSPQALAGLKISPTNDYYQSAGFGWGSTGTLSTVRMNRYTTAAAGATAFTWSNNSLYWIRLRNHTVNTNSRKIWLFGNSEPATFSNVAIASTAWTPNAGYAGVINYNATVFEVHWISVGYNFVAAPFPP